MTSAQGCARHGRIYSLAISLTLSRALACVTWQRLSGVRVRKRGPEPHIMIGDGGESNVDIDGNQRQLIIDNA